MNATYRIFFAAAAWALIAPLPLAFGNASAANAASTGTAAVGYNPYDYPTYKPVNGSVRAAVLPGVDNPIVGIGIIVPNGYPHRILVRAVGPELARYGVANPNPDPKLSVYTNDLLIAKNDNWWSPEQADGGPEPASAASIVAASAASGAFKLDGSSTDAAVILTLGNGTYTFVVTSDHPDGIALLEVYDLDWKLPGALINMSARTRVISGEGATILGFTLNGHGSIRTLIRGVGPSLKAFGIDDVLPDPKLILSVYGSALTWSNGVYNEAPWVEEEAGAFPIRIGSNDALVDYPIGSWFAGAGFSSVLTSKSNESGVVLNEIFFYHWNNDAPVSTNGILGPEDAGSRGAP